MKKVAFMFVAVLAISFASCGNSTKACEECDSTCVDTCCVEEVDTTVADTAAVVDSAVVVAE